MDIETGSLIAAPTVVLATSCQGLDSSPVRASVDSLAIKFAETWKVTLKPAVVKRIVLSVELHNDSLDPHPDCLRTRRFAVLAAAAENDRSTRR